MATKGTRQIQTKDVMNVLEVNNGLITVGQLVKHMQNNGNKTHYITARKRLEEMAFEGLLKEEGYVTEKMYKVKWWRYNGVDKFGEVKVDR